MIMVGNIIISRAQKTIGNNRGQALFEMILFLPFLLFLYTIYYTAGNSINGSINQQKAVRGYFYTLVKGNSYILTKPELKQFTDQGLKNIGFGAIGWRAKSGGGNRALAPCFKFSSLLKNGSTEECDKPDRDEPGVARFIRLFTFYGVCGPMYTEDQSMGDIYYNILPSTQSQVLSCSISK